jgi:hypothetical protein
MQSSSENANYGKIQSADQKEAAPVSQELQSIKMLSFMK